jgi:hypothetical protein
MRKDLPSSSSASSSKSFWGGELGGVGSNFMSVHTVLVPQSVNLLGKQDTLVPSKNLHRAEMQEEADVLSRMVSEKLHVCEESDGKSTIKASTKKDQEASINETLVSLLVDERAAPPSYSEATSPESPSSYPNEQAQTAILGALSRALSAAVPTYSGPGKESTCVGSSSTRLDLNKIQALLDGRAKLVLYDEQSGQIWKDELETRSSTNDTTPTIQQNNTLLATSVSS